MCADKIRCVPWDPHCSDAWKNNFVYFMQWGLPDWKRSY